MEEEVKKDRRRLKEQINLRLLFCHGATALSEARATSLSRLYERTQTSLPVVFARTSDWPDAGTST